MSNQIERIEKEGKENFIFTAVTGEAVSLARSRFEIANDGLKILFILDNPLFFPNAGRQHGGSAHGSYDHGS